MKFLLFLSLTLALTTVSIQQQSNESTLNVNFSNPQFQNPSKKRTLVLIDNYVYLTTHSIFLRDLGKNQDLTVKFASEAAISNGNIMLSKDKVFLYDNVILMCTSLQDLPETNDFNLRTFYDAGNNIMFLADFDTSLWFRNLAKDLGFSLSSAEQYLQDYPNALNTQDPSVFYVSPKENNILFPGQIDLKTTKNSLGKYITNLINV